MRGRMGGMNTDQLDRLRQLSTGIKSAIGEVSAIVVEIKGSQNRELVAESLADLWRDSQFLESKLRAPKNIIPSAH
jgi:hypothetical protein